MNGTFWQSLIAVGASVLGWGLAMIGQAVQARRENNREHYYKVLERTEDIFSRCAGLADTPFDFHQQCVALANAQSSDDSVVVNFITRFQKQLASIYLSAKIFYPGVKIDTGPIVKKTDDLAEAVRKMWTLMIVERGRLDDSEFSKRIAMSQAERETIIKAFTNELPLIMNIMALSLNKTAAKLRIKAEPVTVDRSRMPTPG